MSEETRPAGDEESASRRSVIASGLMALAAGGAWLAVPRSRGGVREPHLADTVPKTFAGWAADTSVSPVLPDEALQTTIRQIYDETFSRTYRDAAGRAVMLVIAYGARQTEGLQAHQPEVCYAAQGFHVEKEGQASLGGKYAGVTPAKVYATQGPRTEPILYWLCVGGEIANFGVKLRWRQIKLGVEGVVAEGFLVRASLIGPDEPGSYETLARFLSQMLDALPPQMRARIAGV